MFLLATYFYMNYVKQFKQLDVMSNNYPIYIRRVRSLYIIMHMNNNSVENLNDYYCPFPE